LKKPIVLKVSARTARTPLPYGLAQVLLFMNIFWSFFAIVLSFIHVNNFAVNPPGGSLKDANSFCGQVNAVPLAISLTYVTSQQTL
jgi:hypothetical protein